MDWRANAKADRRGFRQTDRERGTGAGWDFWLIPKSPLIAHDEFHPCTWKQLKKNAAKSCSVSQLKPWPRQRPGQNPLAMKGQRPRSSKSNKTQQRPRPRQPRKPTRPTGRRSTAATTPSPLQKRWARRGWRTKLRRPPSGNGFTIHGGLPEGHVAAGRDRLERLSKSGLGAPAHEGPP